MRRQTIARTFLGATVLALSLGAFAQAKPSRSDISFMQKAAEGGLAEVELGNLADQKAASEQVKQFGSRMATDHGKANEELTTLAGARAVALPTEPDKDMRKEANKLRKLVGPEFERAYMKLMVADHKKDLKEFRKQAKSGKDPEVKAFAARMVPILQEHLDSALATNDIVQASKRAGERVTGSTRK